MDDAVLFDDDRGRLKNAREEVRAFLGDHLRLELKDEVTMLAPCRVGLPYLGWHLYPSVRRLRTPNRKRTVRRLCHRIWQLPHPSRSRSSLIRYAR